MDNNQKQVVLITGASSGLGLAIAKTFIEKNQFRLILTARESSLDRFDQEGIKESENVWIRAMDVLSKKQRDFVVGEAEEKLGGIDILINNAGYSLRAVVEHVGEMERFQQMDVNFRAPMALIRSVLPTMRQKKSGRIINISSAGGMMAMPTMSIYCASKFALEGASEALWYEVKPWNIFVSLVEPGFINSNSFQNVKLTRESQKSLTNKNDGYYYHYNSMSQFIAKLMKRSPATPDKVAKIVLKTALKKTPSLRVSGSIDVSFFAMLRRFLPGYFYHRLLYYCLPKISRWGD